MNKKFILFSAAVAALATFSACSNEDVLTNNEVKAPVPLTVKVTDNDVTRANATTGSNFNKFYMYSFQLGHSSTSDALWAKNVEFTKGDEGWSGTATWPTSGGKSLFFASNMNVSSATTSDDTNSVTEFAIEGPDTDISSSYSCNPEGCSSTNYAITTEAERNAVNTISNCWNSDAQNGGTDNVKDIVAASNTQGLSSSDGDVELTFDHTMARINYKFKLDFKGMCKSQIGESDWDSNGYEDYWDEDKYDVENGFGDLDYRVLVKSITLRNVKVTGKLNLIDGTWDTTTGVDGAIRLEFPKGNGEYLVIAANSESVGSDDTITEEAEGSMFIIPQNYTEATFNSVSSTAGSPWTEPYFDIECILAIDDNRTGNNTIGYGSVPIRYVNSNSNQDTTPKDLKGYGFGHMYIPLKKPSSMSNGFEKGKTYTLTINLGKGKTWASGTSTHDDAWGFAYSGAN